MAITYGAQWFCPAVMWLPLTKHALSFSALLPTHLPFDWIGQHPINIDCSLLIPRKEIKLQSSLAAFPQRFIVYYVEPNTLCRNVIQFHLSSHCNAV